MKELNLNEEDSLVNITNPLLDQEIKDFNIDESFPDMERVESVKKLSIFSS